jgi:hypothetical protein
MEIKKFHFIDFSKKDEESERLDAVIAEPIDALSPDEMQEVFAEVNQLAEIGHEEIVIPEIEKKLSLTEEELEHLIAKAKAEALEDYKEQELQKEEPTLEIKDFSEEITLLKEKITVELHDLLDKIIVLSLAIAGKIIEKLDSDYLAKQIKIKLQDLGFKETVKIEVPTDDIAEKLSGLGIEISVNNAMLSGDYKIIWCNGFLERNTKEITQAIEEIMLQNKKLN